MKWLLVAFSFLLKLFSRPPIVVEAEKTGAAEEQVKEQADAIKRATDTAAADDAVKHRIDTDAGLRKYEATDPNNRANSS